MEIKKWNKEKKEEKIEMEDRGRKKINTVEKRIEEWRQMEKNCNEEEKEIEVMGIEKIK